MGEVFWNRMQAADLVRLAERDAIVLLPVAAVEQHGPHLPTGTDTFLCEEACRRTAELVQETRPIVVAPTVWMGLSEHHVAFGGTFTVSLATWHAILHDLCLAIGRAGFKWIVIVNGHGGNISALNALTVDLTRQTGIAVASTTYVNFADEDIPMILEDQQNVQHACEAETSMIMAVRPELVNSSQIANAFGPQATQAAVLSQPLHIWKSLKEMTPNGVFGDARRASPAKGEQLMSAVARKFADRLLAGEPWS